MPTVMVTFVQATDVLETFVLFSNILAATDPILTKLFEPKLLGAFIFLNQIFSTKILFDPMFFQLNFVSTQIFFGPNVSFTYILLTIFL